MQASRLIPATRELALSVGKECKAVIRHLLVHFRGHQQITIMPSGLAQKFSDWLITRVLSCALQEHFSGAQLDTEPGDDAEALGNAMEELLDDVLERVDTSLDRARALLKAAEAPASTLASAAKEGPVSAAQPIAGV